MFGIGFTELVVVLVVALLVIGPDKLPAVAKTMGKAFVEFRRVGEDLKKTITDIDLESVVDSGEKKIASKKKTATKRRTVASASSPKAGADSKNQSGKKVT